MRKKKLALNMINEFISSRSAVMIKTCLVQLVIVLSVTMDNDVI